MGLRVDTLPVVRRSAYHGGSKRYTERVQKGVAGVNVVRQLKKEKKTKAVTNAVCCKLRPLQMLSLDLWSCTSLRLINSLVSSHRFQLHRHLTLLIPFFLQCAPQNFITTIAGTQLNRFTDGSDGNSTNEGVATVEKVLIALCTQSREWKREVSALSSNSRPPR